MNNLIIFNFCGILAVTTKENYNKRIMDERKVTKLKDFESPAEIIEYYCKYFNCKQSDFEILV